MEEPLLQPTSSGEAPCPIRAVSVPSSCSILLASCRFEPRGQSVVDAHLSPNPDGGTARMTSTRRSGRPDRRRPRTDRYRLRQRLRSRAERRLLPGRLHRRLRHRLRRPVWKRRAREGRAVRPAQLLSRRLPQPRLHQVHAGGRRRPVHRRVQGGRPGDRLQVRRRLLSPGLHGQRRRGLLGHVWQRRQGGQRDLRSARLLPHRLPGRGLPAAQADQRRHLHRRMRERPPADRLHARRRLLPPRLPRRQRRRLHGRL